VARAIRGKGGAMPVPPRGPGRTAQEQLASAHERVRRAQERVSGRLSRSAFATSFGRSGRFSTKPNPGVAGAFFLFLTVMVAIPMALVIVSLKRENTQDRSDPGLSRHVQIATDFGNLEVNVDDGDRIREAIAQVHEAAQGIKSDLREGSAGVQADVSELNKLGEKVSGFFDAIREKQGTSTTESAAPALPAVPEVPGVESARSPALEPGSAGTLLMLNVLPGDVTDEAPRLASLAERLASHGFAVRGVVPSDADTEVLAAGKRVVELSQPDDAEGAARVQAWLDQGETGIDAVLWVGVGKEPGAVMRRLVVREGFDAKRVAAALAGRRD
jgi:hypothetical protein